MCASGRGNDVWVSSEITTQYAQLRAPLSPYKQLAPTALMEWNAPVEYKKPCSCYFPTERGLLEMTHL